MANEQDDFMGGGFKTFPFDNVGDRVAGVVVQTPVKEQQRDMVTNELSFWDNRQPKWMYRLQIQTELRDSDDPYDDGIRTLHLSWKRLDAVRAAIRAAGAKNIEIGGQLALQFTEFGPVTKKGFNAPKIGFKAWYKPPIQEAEPAFMDSTPSAVTDSFVQATPLRTATPVAGTYDPAAASSTLAALKAMRDQQVAEIDSTFPASVVNAPAHHSTEEPPF